MSEKLEDGADNDRSEECCDLIDSGAEGVVACKWFSQIRGISLLLLAQATTALSVNG